MSGSGGGDASVMDATNLLKGALGIGTRGSTSRVGDDTTPDLFTSDGSKKQSKAKINNKKAGKQQQQKRGDGKTARTSKKDGDNRSNSAGKDRSKSASKPRKQSSEKQQRGKNKSNNFAWSAFQTSPDPSSLPIPAFSSGGDVGGEASGGGANVNVNETNPISQFGGSTASNSVSKSGSSAAAPTASNADGMDLMATLGVDSGVTPATAPAPAPAPAPAIAQTPPPQQYRKPKELDALSELMGAGFNQPQQPALHQQPGYPGNHFLMGPMSPHSPYGQPLSNPQHQPGMMTINIPIPHNAIPGGPLPIMTPSGIPVTVIVPPQARPGMVVPFSVPMPVPPMMMPPGGGGMGFSPMSPQQQQTMTPREAVNRPHGEGGEKVPPDSHRGAPDPKQSAQGVEAFGRGPKAGTWAAKAAGAGVGK